MIIYDKIKKKYDKYDIEEIFPRITARKIIFERDSVRMDVIAKNISLNEIGYTLQDYIADYKKDKIYKEIGMVFEIYKSGMGIENFIIKHDLGDYFKQLLKLGFDYNAPLKNGYKIIDLFHIKVDFSNFSIDKYDTHIELFGDKEELKKFKEKFKIHHDVLFEPIKKSWHLAFDGLLADYIKHKKED